MVEMMDLYTLAPEIKKEHGVIFEMSERPVFSIIAPVHNEAETLPELHRRVSDVMNKLNEPWELILVNDGSRDDSASVIAGLHNEDEHVKGISFSRNFGFQVAVTAGLDVAQGDAVILIDADLQDPPEVIPDMIARWRAGYDVVYGVRGEREGETAFKKFTASLFYRLIQRITDVNIPVDTGDFRLMDSRVVKAIRQMPEHHRFLRGMVSWVGFRQTGVTYKRNARYAGQTKFTFKKMLRFAMDAITSFSYLPLQVASWIGAAFTGLSGLLLLGLIVAGLAQANGVLLAILGAFAALFLIGGIQLICLGLFGEYLGRMYDDVRKRPLYLVARQWGIESTALRAR